MQDEVITENTMSDDGVSLKRRLAKALFREKVRALMLIAPLLIFILFTFVLPIADMLFRSVDNREVKEIIPATVVAMQDWDEKTGTAPDEPVFEAFFSDMTIAIEHKLNSKLGRRFNFEEAGMSSLFRKLRKGIPEMDPNTELKPQFIALNEKWGRFETWDTIKRYSPSYTNGYYVNAIDMKKTSEGLALRPESERVYIKLFIRTILMTGFITLCCFLLGYPVAWLLATLRMKTSNMLMILVLLPFWTSLLVRTSAWKVLLQQEGVINDILVWIRLVPDDHRLQLINNQFGTIITMTHILLPFMILPLYSVMRTIPPNYTRAAKSMGATDWTAFWRVYFPQSIPGIGAGAILVFILAIGYYITPELVGGTKGTFISNRIAYNISFSGNWGLAAALGAILLVLVIALYWVYDKIVGIDNVKLG